MPRYKYEAQRLAAISKKDIHYAQSASRYKYDKYKLKIYEGGSNLSHILTDNSKYFPENNKRECLNKGLSCQPYTWHLWKFSCATL